MEPNEKKKDDSTFPQTFEKKTKWDCPEMNHLQMLNDLIWKVTEVYSDLWLLWFPWCLLLSNTQITFRISYGVPICGAKRNRTRVCWEFLRCWKWIIFFFRGVEPTHHEKDKKSDAEFPQNISKVADTTLAQGVSGKETAPQIRSCCWGILLPFSRESMLLVEMSVHLSSPALKTARLPRIMRWWTSQAARASRFDRPRLGRPFNHTAEFHLVFWFNVGFTQCCHKQLPFCHP